MQYTHILSKPILSLSLEVHIGETCFPASACECGTNTMRRDPGYKCNVIGTATTEGTDPLNRIIFITSMVI
jgi:hypothetical protein